MFLFDKNSTLLDCYQSDSKEISSSLGESELFVKVYSIGVADPLGRPDTPGKLRGEY